MAEDRLAMFQRTAQPSSSSTAPAGLIFEEDVEHLIAENAISSQRGAKLLNKASRAGIKGISKKVRRSLGKNQARDITRKKLRNTKWPEAYIFQCRVKDRRTKKEWTTDLAILLIHEVLKVIWDLGLEAVLLSEANLDSTGKQHMEWMRQHLDVDTLWGFGLHGDGAPVNYDRTESVIIISLNLPGLPGKNGRLRIPLIVLPDHCVGENTFDDIFEVVAWSLQ